MAQFWFNQEEPVDQHPLKFVLVFSIVNKKEKWKPVFSPPSGGSGGAQVHLC